MSDGTVRISLTTGCSCSFGGLASSEDKEETRQAKREVVPLSSVALRRKFERESSAVGLLQAWNQCASPKRRPSDLVLHSQFHALVPTPNKSGHLLHPEIREKTRGDIK